MSHDSNKVRDEAKAWLTSVEPVKTPGDKLAAILAEIGVDHVNRIVGVMDAWLCDPTGLVVQRSMGNLNTLTNEGANAIRSYIAANTAFSAASGPYIGLVASGAPGPMVVGTTLTGMTTSWEPATANNYARIRPTWSTASQGNFNNGTAAAFSCTGSTWISVGQGFLTFTAAGYASGIALSYATLSGGPFVVGVGSTLNVTYNWTIS